MAFTTQLLNVVKVDRIIWLKVNVLKGLKVEMVKYHAVYDSCQKGTKWT